MHGQRGQFTQAPMNNLKNEKRQAAARAKRPRDPSQEKRYDLLGMVFALVLPVLFLLALLISSNIIRWAFLGLTLVGIGLMWLLGAFVRSARSTLTVVYLALAVVIGVALLVNNQGPRLQQPSANVQQQDAIFSQNGGMLPGQSGLYSPAPSPSPDNEIVSAAKLAMIQFMEYWRMDSVPGMISLCAPSWLALQDKPEMELFQLLGGNTPESYEVESLSGSDGDSSRIVSLKVRINPNNGMPVTLNRMQVLMFKVNSKWYVDPQSLKGTPIDEAKEAAQQNRPILSSTVVPTATPDPQAEANRIYVYYNKVGNGTKYHADEICDAVSESYWPLEKLDFSLINSNQFKKLIPCEKCNAPARPNAY